jgi:hypothetical protein
MKFYCIAYNACEKGDNRILNEIIKFHQIIHQDNNYCWSICLYNYASTPFNVAFHFGHLKFVKLLILKIYYCFGT